MSLYSRAAFRITMNEDHQTKMLGVSRVVGKSGIYKEVCPQVATSHTQPPKLCLILSFKRFLMKAVLLATSKIQENVQRFRKIMKGEYYQTDDFANLFADFQYTYAKWVQ